MRRACYLAVLALLAAGCGGKARIVEQSYGRDAAQVWIFRATDRRNLWPEPYPRAAAVDRIENELNAKVCAGSLSLRAAQEQESVLKHSQG